MTFCKILK